MKEDRGGFFGIVLGLFWAGALREDSGRHEPFGRDTTDR